MTLLPLIVRNQGVLFTTGVRDIYTGTVNRFDIGFLDFCVSTSNGVGDTSSNLSREPGLKGLVADLFSRAPNSAIACESYVEYCRSVQASDRFTSVPEIEKPQFCGAEWISIVVLKFVAAVVACVLLVLLGLSKVAWFARYFRRKCEELGFCEHRHSREGVEGVGIDKTVEEGQQPRPSQQSTRETSPPSPGESTAAIAIAGAAPSTAPSKREEKPWHFYCGIHSSSSKFSPYRLWFKRVLLVGIGFHALIEAIIIGLVADFHRNRVQWPPNLTPDWALWLGVVVCFADIVMIVLYVVAERVFSWFDEPVFG